jgi:hypothetical protein
MAHWKKYPSELMRHVEGVDYLSRRIDPLTGFLHTERLITCRQPIPSFISRVFMLKDEGSHSYFLERSIVDPLTKRVSMLSRNLTFSSLLSVEERCVYIGTPPPPTDPNVSPEDESRSQSDGGPPSITLFDQHARITCFSKWSPIREGVEDFCLSRCSANSERGRIALQSAIDRL